MKALGCTYTDFYTLYLLIKYNSHDIINLLLLQKGKTVMRYKKIEIGDRYGRLTVIDFSEPHTYPSGEKRSRFKVQCDCGSDPFPILSNNLKNGNSLSCGCLAKELNATHGMYNTRQYQCWADMKSRCDNPKNKFYHLYGGNGITYCEKWKTFNGFWEDMEEGYSNDLTLNRVDPYKGYYKENCKWDDKSVQGHQKRKRLGTLLDVIGGVLDKRNNKLYARIRRNGVGFHLGDYETTEEIAEAYDYASEVIYGDRPNKTLVTRKDIAVKVQRFLDNPEESLIPKGESNSRSKLTNAQVAEIWGLLQEGVLCQKEIAERYGVLQANISVINRGLGWNHITGLPKGTRNKRKSAEGHSLTQTGGIIAEKQNN